MGIIQSPFASATQVSAQSNETEIAFIGDYGFDSYAQAGVANLIKGWQPDYIVTVGDNRYDLSDFDIAVGKYFCDYLHGVTPGANCPSGGNASINRFYPTVGNHDYSDGNGIDDYLDYFDIPGAGALSSNTSGTELYYDFTLGSVHFISLNSEAFDDEYSEQAQWAKRQLEQSTSLFQIVLLHRAPYSSSSRGIRAPHMRWPFAAWGADAVISGDEHFYERLELDTIPYIITGAGGRSLYKYGSTIDAASKVRYANDYGALKLIASDEGLKFEYYTRDGVQRDRFEATQIDLPCNTSSFVATEDTWINSLEPNTNYASEQALLVDGSPDYGTLMRWDLSAIPAHSEVMSNPKLTIDVIDSTYSQYNVYVMESDWRADQATWKSAKTNVSWSGGAGGIGDKGELIGQLQGSNSRKEIIELNDEGLALVKGWIGGTVANHGVLIANYDSADNGADFMHRVQMTIEYCWAIPTSVHLVSAETTQVNTLFLLAITYFSLSAISINGLLRRRP